MADEQSPWSQLNEEKRTVMIRLAQSWGIQMPDGTFVFPSEQTAKAWAIEAYTASVMLAK